MKIFHKEKTNNSIWKNNKKGFTLVEVMVVLVILSIIAAIAVPSIIGYNQRADQRARNEIARSVFMISQNAMTHLYTTGQEHTLSPDGQVEIDKIKPAVSEKEKEENADNIRYLVLNKEEDNKASKALYQLIDKYISDKEILNRTVLVEYNYKTGKVLSAFYSEEADDIGYGTGADYNAYDREEESLKDGHMGYWGVDSTGKAEETDIEDVEAQLVDYTGGKTSQGNNINKGNNYGLLTLECKLPKEPAAYEYEINLYPQKGTNKTITIGNGGDYGWTDIGSSLDEAIGGSGNGMYLDGTADGHDLLVLVLDSAYRSYSITDKFPSIGCGYLSAEIKVKAEGEEKTATAESVHSYFDKEEGEDTNTAYGVASIRHLKNINHNNLYTADYVQTKNISCRDHNNQILLFEPIGGDTGFLGTYEGISKNADGKQTAYKIYDLTISGTGTYTGLFGYLRPGTEVDGVTVTYSEEYLETYRNAASSVKSQMFISGTGNVGIITGQNNGEITNCTVEGRVTLKGNSVYGGGIAGRNAWDGAPGSRGGVGTISYCSSIASVYDERNIYSCIGGITGHSRGSITYCEVGTAAGSDSQTGIAAYFGQPYFGANPIDSGNKKLRDYDYSDHVNIKNDVVQLYSRGWGNIGGIVGAQSYHSGDAARGSVSYCVNAAKITQTTYNNSSYTGGIVAHLRPNLAVRYCYNAGEIDSKAQSAGGIVGVLQNSSSVKSCYNTADVTGRSYVGGIVGRALEGTNVISDTYNMGTATGTSSNNTRGVYGDVKLYTYMPVAISNCAFLKNEKNDRNLKSYGMEMANNISNLRALTKKFDGLESEDSNGLGPFSYKGSCFDINNENCKLGTDFHRTPWNETE